MSTTIINFFKTVGNLMMMVFLLCCGANELSAAPLAKHKLVFIDSRVSNSDLLEKEWNGQAEVHLVDQAANGFEAVFQKIRDRRDVDSVHLISHGRQGEFDLGAIRVNSQTLASQTDALAGIGRALGREGGLYVYGCEVASGATGRQLIQQLSEATGTSVHASTNLTGSSRLGGDWVLEHSEGKSPAKALAARDYPAVLATQQTINLSGLNVYVRPGGTSRTWVYGVGQAPPTLTTYEAVTAVAIYDVVGFNWLLTRGKFQYSSNSGASWTDYVDTSKANGNTGPINYVSVTGTIWRFVDNQPADTTTSNNFGNGWRVASSPNNAGSGGSVGPDNPPTNITSDVDFFLNDVSAGTAVATLTPADTGYTTGGYWAIDSQSVPNLFTLTFDSTTGNTATLKIGTGAVPAVGQSPTVTVRYYDAYQTDSSGNPINGQGISKTFSYLVRDNVSNDLNFSNNISVNTFKTNDQIAPAVATLSNGNFVTVWQSAGQGGNANSVNAIYGQIFNSSGIAQGSEFAISPAGDGLDKTAPVVTPLNNGRFVVAYTAATASNGLDIAYRIVEANGTLGSQLTANTTTTGDQTAPTIATLSDGSFIIGWISSGNVYAQQFGAAAGAKIASQLTIDSAGLDVAPVVAALDNGAYVFAWGDGTNFNIKSVLSTAPSTVINVVSSGLASSGISFLPYVKATALAGGYVLTWPEYDVSYGQGDIYFQRYSNAGATQGAKTKVNLSTGPSVYMDWPAVATLSGGGFIVTWQGYDYDLNGVFGRRYDASGTATDASVFQINQYRRGDQNSPVVTPLASDAFAAAWTGANADTSSAGVQARVLLNGYLVNYLGNSNTGGSPPVDSNLYANAATVTVLGNTGSLVRSGYTFGGWNTAANGSGTTYAPASTFSMGTSSVTLYALWSAIPTYSVSYDGNGNTGGAVPSDSTAYTNGQTVTVLGNTGSLTKTGYTFAGWNTAANGGGTAYAAAATFAMGSANVVLYAQWTANAPTATTGSASSLSISGATLGGTVNDNGLTTSVSFDYGLTNAYGTNVAATTGGTVTAGSGATAVAVSLTGLTCNTSYHFRVKASSLGGTTNGSDGTFTTSACPPTYTVTYDGNGNTGGTAPTDGTAYLNGQTVTVASNTGSLVRTGYTFSGWNTAANGSGTNYAAAATFSMGSANVILYAKWTAIVNGSCGTAQNVVSLVAPANGLCTTGNPSVVLGAGGTWNWSCVGINTGTTATCSAPQQPTSTGTGAGTASISGANGWTLDSANTAGFIPVSGNPKSPGVPPPNGFNFPHGLFDFKLILGNSGSQASITITYPTALPAGTVYWKYGPEPGNASYHWYRFPAAVISGNTITLPITDGQLGDDDLSANQVIIDAGGPGIPAGADATAVPTMSRFSLMLLSAALGLLALLGRNRQRHRASIAKTCSN